MIKPSSIEEAIARATRRKELEKQEKVIRTERTKLKYKDTQLRIEEIDKKISRLQQERDNLVRKQLSRRQFLEEQQEKR